MIIYISRCWPYGNRLKEQLFVDEIEHMLVYVKPEHVQKCRPFLLKRIKKSLTCEQYEVCLECVCDEIGHLEAIALLEGQLVSQFLRQRLFRGERAVPHDLRHSLQAVQDFLVE